MAKYWVLLVFISFAGAVIFAANARDNIPPITTALPAKEKEALSVITARATHAFDVEVVSTGDELRHGLMFRKELPKKTGMLFNFGSERRMSMWMKNTYIPLDMLFINQRGIIVDIAEHTTPHSLETITSRRPASAVLEIPAGTSNHYGIRVGDTVQHPIFNP